MNHKLVRRIVRWCVIAFLSMSAFLSGAFLGQLPEASADRTDPWPGVGDNYCASSGNYVSIACFYGQVAFGAADYWHNNPMRVTNQSYLLPPNQGHINHTIWAYSGSPCTAWVEVGLTHGYHGNDWYGYYHAYRTQGGTYSDTFDGFASADGSTHVYKIRYDGGTQYSIFRDDGAGYQLITVIGGDFGYGICDIDTGLEETRIQIDGMSVPVDGGFFSETFDIRPQAWLAFAREWEGGVWQYGATSFWVDYPCGNHPSIGTNLSPPYCLNGLFSNYDPTWWKANHLAQ